jgi:hypothetical protein
MNTSPFGSHAIRMDTYKRTRKHPSESSGSVLFYYRPRYISFPCELMGKWDCPLPALLKSFAKNEAAKGCGTR